MGTGFALCLASTAASAPSSNVAFTTETKNLVAAGEAETGKQKAVSCAGCHGSEGVATAPIYPSLAGQLATYTYKQLKDYKDGTRANAMMAAFVTTLSDQDMADLAAWYATLPPPAATPAGPELPLAQRLVQHGDGKRLIPSCASCHGSRGEGQAVAVPALAGQHAAHFSDTMRAYKNASRANDVYAVMRSIAKELSEEEIQQLGTYYATLGQ